MENIFKQRGSTTRTSSGSIEVKEIKNLTRTFLQDLKAFSSAQKLNLIYSNLTGKKPDPNLDSVKKFNRILFEQKFGDKIKHTNKFLKKGKKFKFPVKWKSIMKKGNKKGRQILIWYLNAKGIIEPPQLHPIYSSDMIIIRNKPHQVDPRAFWRMGKYQCLLIREIDRRPVSNLDYNEIKKRGDATDSDEFIIKAAMQAFVGGQKKKPVNRTVMIVIGVIAILTVIYFATV